MHPDIRLFDPADPIACRLANGGSAALRRDALHWRPGAYGIAFDAARRRVLLSRVRGLNVWELPGGAVELGEAFPAAVAREYLEETGVAVMVGEGVYFCQDFFAWDAAATEGWATINLFYLVTLQGEPDPRYVEPDPGHGLVNYGARWITLDDLETIPLLSHHYDAIQRALEWLEYREGPPDDDE